MLDCNAMFGKVWMLGMELEERVYTKDGEWTVPHGPAWLLLSVAAGKHCQGPRSTVKDA